MKFIKNKQVYELLILGFLLIFSVVLRFANLSYSEFQGDEVRALYDSRLPLSQFILEQRKGPVQFYATFVISKTLGYYDEGLVRLPFAIAGFVSVFIVYLLSKELFGKRTAVITTFLFAVNGFFVAFSRIVQYQSFTYMFYLLALLLIVYFYRTGKVWLLPLGALSFALSFLSHYAVFALLPCVYFIVKGLLLHKISKKVIYSLVISFLVFASVTGSFYLPFFMHPSFSNDTGAYLFQRISGGGDKITSTFKTYQLYNPFISLYFVAFFACLGLVFGRLRMLPLILWFGLPYFFLNFVTSVPGTHIYNYVLPALFLAGYGAAGLMNLLKKHQFLLPFGLVLASLLVFLGIQSYMLFVDHEPEYPWSDKEVLLWTAKRPDDNVYHLSIFGFPYNRRLQEVGFIVKSRANIGAVQSNEGQRLLRYYVNPPLSISPEYDAYIYVYNAQSFVKNRKGRIENLKPDATLSRGNNTLVDVYFLSRVQPVN